MSVMRVCVLNPYTNCEVRRPSCSEDMADFQSRRQVGSRVTPVMDFFPASFQLHTPFILDLQSGMGRTERQTDHSIIPRPMSVPDIHRVS